MGRKVTFTAVKRVELVPPDRPFRVQALVCGTWTTVGGADHRATAETIARGFRVDNRGARTRITEKRHPGGFAYIAV